MENHSPECTSKDYPYTDYREELSILILRARHEMAIYSVEDKEDGSLP